MPRPHVPVLAGEVIEALDPQPGQVAVDCTLGGGGPCAARGRAAGAGRTADRHRPRPAGRARLRGARGGGALPHAPRPRRLRHRPRDAARRGRPGRHGLPRPRHVLHAGRHARARLLLRLRRAAGHAHGPRPAAHRRGHPQHLGPAPDRARAARLRGGALRGPDRADDRPPAAAHDDVRARRRDHRRHPRARAVRGRAPGQADVPGHPHRRQRRAGPARRRAAARVGAARGRTAGWRPSPSTRSRTGASSASWPSARRAASARPTCPCAAAGARPRPSWSSAAPSSPPRARWTATRARSPPGCGRRASWRRRREVGDRPPALARRAARGGASRSARRRRTRPAPASPAPARRGPRPAPAPARRRAAALPRRGSTGAFERLRALPDHRVVDRLLRSRLWIIIVGTLLGGIVAMQVSLLKLNSGISRAVETAATLERQNAGLEAAIARLGATERIRSMAESRGMVLPPAGEVHYLGVRPSDAERAAQTMTPPTEAARALLANGGVVPGSLAAEAAVGTATGTVATDDRPGRPTATAPRATTAATTTARPPPRASRHASRNSRWPSSRSASGSSSPSSSPCCSWPAPAPAGWASSRPSSLQAAAATQQVSDIVVPARRGTIMDRNGVELAVSRPAVTIAATPYLIEDPAQVAARLAPLLRRHDDDLLRELVRRDTGYVYLARHVRARRAPARWRSSASRGSSSSRSSGATTRARWMASQVLGMVGGEGHGLAGLEYLFDGDLAGRDGERRLVKDALGDPIELRDTVRAARGRSVRLTLDANVQNPAESVLAQVGRDWRPAGRHRGRHGPAHGRDPRPRQLAARQRERAGRGAGRGHAEPRHGGQLRAGLDLQGDHGGRRAGGEHGHARHRVDAPADAPRGRPRRQRVPRPRLRHAHHARHPRAVLERRRGQDRRDARRPPLRPLGAPVRLRPPDRHRPAGRGARHPAPAGEVLGLLHGQPAARPGPRRHADPDGHRVRRDRQRRHPAPAAHRGGGREPPDAAAQGPPRHLRADRRLRAPDARGRPRPGRHRVGRPHRRLRARGQDRHGGEGRTRPAATPRPSSWPRSSASPRRATPSCSSP